MNDTQEDQFTDTLALALGGVLPKAGRAPGWGVVTARLAVDVGIYFGVRVIPVATVTVAMNAAGWKAAQGVEVEGRHTVAITGDVAEDRMCHLLLRVGAERFIDPTIGRFADKSKGLPLPANGFVGVIPTPFEKKGDILTISGLDGGAAVVYQYSGATAWKHSQQWRKSSQTMKLAGSAIRALRA